MVEKRKLAEIVPSSEQGTVKAANRRSAGDGDESTSLDISVISLGSFGDSEELNLTHDNGSGTIKLTMPPSGREAVRELERLPRGGEHDDMCSSPSHPLPRPPRYLDCLVIVPPTRQSCGQRLVSSEIFAQGLLEALFGPTLMDEEACIMWSNSDATIPSFEYFIAGHDIVGVAPPVRSAAVHIRLQYSLYLTWHRAGLARLAHEDEGTTVDTFGRNRGLIKSAVHRLLMNEQHEKSSTACQRCNEPADWTTSCCSLSLCSYCLPREFLKNHLTGNSCEASGKGISLHPLNSSKEVSGVSCIEDGWLCTRQLIVQVEDETSNRTRQKDIFLFRTYSLLEDIEGLRPARKKTTLYHMTRNGTLRTVVTIGRDDLAFLW